MIRYLILIGLFGMCLCDAVAIELQGESASKFENGTIAVHLIMLIEIDESNIKLDLHNLTLFEKSDINNCIHSSFFNNNNNDDEDSFLIFAGIVFLILFLIFYLIYDR